MVRIFIGVFIPKNVTEHVTKIQEMLGLLPFGAKFVELDNLHISLAFLGNIENYDISQVKLKLDDICNRHENFEVTIDGLMMIPNEKFVRVIALNVISDELEIIRKEIVKQIGGESHHAHLTLCRVKSLDDKEKFIDGIENLSFGDLKFNVNKLSIIQSLLQRTGPIYTTIHDSYLK